jgi:hypothetical protein
MRWNRRDERGGVEFWGAIVSAKAVKLMSVELPKRTDLASRNAPVRGNRFASASPAVIHSTFQTLQASVDSSSVAVQYANGAYKYFLVKYPWRLGFTRLFVV